MRVVQVNCTRDPLQRNGDTLLDAWPTLPAVASAVREAGAQVSVVQSAHEDAECERDGVPFRFVAEPWLGGRPAAGYAPLRVRRAVGAFCPDVVHVNGLGFPFHTRALSSLGVPVLVQDHADNPGSRLNSLRRWGLKHVTGFAFTSREQASPFLQNRSIREGVPIFAIPESSTHFRDGDVREARRTTGLYGNPAVLWVGHLNENKDPLTILAAFAQASGRLPDPHLWFCYTEAPLLTRVEARLAADRELGSRVHLLGPVPHDRVEWLCRAADFFVLASRRESCGFALLEALACGATPIVSDIPAFRAITESGTVGALCKPADANAFAAALVALAHENIDALRAKAIAHFRSGLSFPVLGKKLLAAYEAIADLYAQAHCRTP
ncbi:MAG TPA: glycosyltransferase family 4 protein [Rhizomicrobium sp.]|nr:glycosyltransferase family 4 protein [Rhizomicrobium sp.]